MLDRTSINARLGLFALTLALTGALLGAPASALARTTTRVVVSSSSTAAKVYHPLRLTGRLTTRAGRSLKGRVLQLEGRTSSTDAWSVVTTSSTNASGRAYFGVQPSRTTTYRVRFLGDSGAKASAGTRKIKGTGFTLKFHDEFDGSAVDTATWTTQMRWGDRSAGTLNIFTPSALEETGGALVITATKNLTSDEPTAFPYFSGAISAHGDSQYHFKYGYIETRARIPRGQALWPAVWMLPTQSVNGCELDILEARGQFWWRNLMTVHWGNQQAGLNYNGDDLSAGYHTFAVDWSPTRVIWYRDGVERWRVTGASKVPQDPMYLIANMVVGGWGGIPNATTVVPASFYVDYVRVWQK